jgi:hypothetical protein
MQVKDTHSVSRGYDNDWPMKNILIAVLKNSSEQHRRKMGTVKSRVRAKEPELIEESLTGTQRGTSDDA